MADDKDKKLPASMTLGPNEAYGEQDKKSAKDEGDEKSQLPDKGRYFKVTALGNNQRVVRGKVYSNQGTFIPASGKDWSHGEVNELRKDPTLAVERYEDGELVATKWPRDVEPAKPAASAAAPPAKG